MKIFAISPKEFSERRKNIKLQLDKLGIPYEFVDVTPADLMAGNVLDINLNPSDITPQHACAAGHLVAYARILEQGLQQALVVEDDVVFKRGFLSALHDAVAVNNEKGVVSFYSANSKVGYFSKLNSIPLSSGGLYHPLEPRYFRSGVAYLIGSKVAESILGLNRSLVYLADSWDKFYINSDRECFDSLRLYYPFFVEFSYEKTSLDYNKSGLAEAIENRFSWLPGFHQVNRMRRKFILWRKRSNIRFVEKKSDYF